MRRTHTDLSSQAIRNLAYNPRLGTESVAQTIRTNLCTSPSFETASGTTTVETNMVQYPSFETADSTKIQRQNLIANADLSTIGSTAEVRRNLLTNPSLETTSGSIAEIRRNLSVNPSFEAAGTPTTMRTNLALNPNAVTGTGWFNANSMTINWYTNQAGGPTGAFARVAATGSATGTGYFSPVYGNAPASGSVASAGKTYTVSGYVRATMTNFVQPNIRLRWKNAAGTTLSDVDVVASSAVNGQWIRLSASGVAPTNTAYIEIGMGYVGRDISHVVAGDTVDMTGVLAEESSTLGDYFSGATTGKNLIGNPSFDSNISGGWTNRWFGNGGGAGTYVWSAGTGINGGAAYRKTWTTANTSNVVDVGVSQKIPVIGGMPYTASIYQRSSITSAMTIYATWYDATDTYMGSLTSTANNKVTPAGVWTRHSMTLTPPAGAAYGNFIFGPYSATSPMAVGDYIDWDRAQVELGTTLTDYEDGVEVPYDFTYAWSGTANASASYQKYMYTTQTAGSSIFSVQSSSWSQSGAKSLRLIPSSSIADSYSAPGGDTGAVQYGFAANETYTVSATCRLAAAQTGTLDGRARRIVVYTRVGTDAYVSVSSDAAPNATGETRLSITFTVPSGVTSASFRLYNGASKGNGDVWWDNLLVEKTSAVKPYFDGTTTQTNFCTNPSFETDTTGWSQTAGSTYTRDTSKKLIGGASLKVGPLSTNTYSGVGFYKGLAVDKVYTYSAYIWAESGSEINFASDALGVNTSIFGNGKWQRVSVTGTKLITNSSTAFFIRARLSAQPTFWVDGVVIEEGPTATTYFEGSGEYTHAWTGTAHSSESIKTAPRAVGTSYTSIYSVATQSSIGTTRGSKSVRITPTNTSGDTFLELGTMIQSGYTFKANTTYTLSADRTLLAAQTGVTGTTTMRAYIGSELSPTFVSSADTELIGTKRVHVRFTTGESTTLSFLRLYFGSGYSGGEVWYDNIVLEEGVTDGSYFDGSTGVNLVGNPSMEPDISGWSPKGSTAPTLSLDSTVSFTGTKSLKVVQTSTTTSQGVGYTVSGLTVGKVYTMSGYIYVPSGNIDVISTITSLSYGSATTASDRDMWTRVAMTFAATATTHQIGFDCVGNAQIGKVFYVDAASLVEGSEAPNPDFTYTWTGSAHSSTSVQNGVAVSERTTLNTTAVNYQSLAKKMIGKTSGAIFTKSDATGTTLVYPPNEYTIGTGQNQLTQGSAYTYSMWVWVPPNSGTVRLQELISGSNGAVNTKFGQWDRISVTFTAGATTQLRLRSLATIPSGTTIYWANELLEESLEPLPYFDVNNPHRNLSANQESLSGMNRTYGVGFAGSLWTRATASLGASGTNIVRQYVNLADLSHGGTYTTSVTLANDQSVAQYVSLDWCDSGHTYITLQPGEIKRISATSYRPAYTDVYRFADIEVYKDATTARSILFKDWMIEPGAVATPFISGTGDYTYAWGGTIGASNHLQQAPGILGWAHATKATVHQSALEPKLGTKVGAVATKGFSGDGAYLNDITILPYVKYTMSIWVKTAYLHNFTGIMRWKDSGYATISDTAVDMSSSITVGVWSRVFMTGIAPANAVRMQPIWRINAVHAPTTFYLDGAMLVEGHALTKYFDGTTTDTNMVSNPSFEAGTTGWNAGANWTIATSTEQKYLGKQSMKITRSNATQGNGYTNTYFNTLTAGKTYTASFYVYGGTGLYTIQARGPATEERNKVVTFSAPGASWVRQSVTFTAAATGGCNLFLTDDANGAVTSGATIYLDAVMLEESELLRDYYEGAGDFTYAWSGTAHANTSTKKAPTVQGWTGNYGTAGRVAWQSSLPLTGTGSKSIAVISGLPNVDTFSQAGSALDGVTGNLGGRTFTISGTIRTTEALPAGSDGRAWSLAWNAYLSDGGYYAISVKPTQTAAGTYRVVGTGTFPANATSTVYFRVYNGSKTEGNVVWWDDVSIIEGGVSPLDPYFDGSTPASDDYTYAWSGTANASTSTKKAPGVYWGAASKSGSNTASSFNHRMVTAPEGKRVAQWVSPAGTPSSSWRVAGFYSNTFDYGNLKAGRNYTLVVRWRARNWLSGDTFRVQLADGTALNPVMGYSASMILNTEGWQEYRNTFTALNNGTGNTMLYCALPPVAPPTTDGIFEIRDWMLVEGEYKGDYVDGSKPLSKWEGTADASTSLGYPPQLLDIAGKPMASIHAESTNLIPISGQPFDDCTLYVVYDAYAEQAEWTTLVTVGGWANGNTTTDWAGKGGFSYGRRNGGDLQTSHSRVGTVANSNQSGLGSVMPGGTIGFKPQRHVVALSMTDAVTKFRSVLNGGTEFVGTLQPGNGVAKEFIKVRSASSSTEGTSSTGAKVLAVHYYPTAHSLVTRVAVSRYLGNKYGANVA